ncbi:hypothetical protein [Sphingobacterium sp.]|uniref:hypothetical protein n=1 Tax=Sphingobacterium sp. TaxID=341027 RepID=UPI0028A210E5|nr:hypothetical protein [Sphingobacterium sp.]
MNNINKALFLSVIAFLAFTSSSCQKDVINDKIEPGKAYIELNLAEDFLAGDDSQFETKASTRATAINPIVSDTSMKYGEHMLDVQLIDSKLEDMKLNRPGSGSGGGLKAAAVSQVNRIAIGTRYRMIAFDSNGNYVAERVYTHGSEATQDSMKLDAGKTYSFIVYSFGSTTTDPAAVTYLNNVKKLDNVQLTGVTQDLMVYMLKNKALVYGTNRLDVVMKHKFSLITTTIEMSSNMNGFINKLNDVKFNGVSSSANYTFATENITYNNLGNGIAQVTFPSLGTGLRKVTSVPTLVIHETATDKTLSFGTLGMDDVAKAYSVPNIKVTPGHKYNLILRFRTCTQEVKLADDVLNWNYRENGNQTGVIGPDGQTIPNGQLLTKAFTAPASDYGFTFDFFQLDNAFNMKINDQWMVIDPDEGQIQFQTYNNTANNEGIITRNIEFIDGSEYSDRSDQINKWGIPPIWDLRGTNTNPIIRVSISKTGAISILGSKTSGGPLVQLRLRNKASFNSAVVWNTAGTNKIEITQKVSNNTIVIGRGYGKAKIACP